MSPTPRSATPSPTTPALRSKPCPASKRSSPWSSPGSTPSTLTRTRNFAKLSKNFASTTPRFSSSPRVPLPWASDSAAASSVCCTWRSFRNVSSANSISTSSPPLPACATRSTRPTVRWSRSTTRRAGSIPAKSRKIRRASHSRHHSYQRRICRRNSRPRRRKARQAEDLRIRQLLARHAALRIAAQRNRPRLLRPSQVRLPWLRVLSTTISPTGIGNRRWSSSTSSSPESPSTPSRSSCIAMLPTNAARPSFPK